MKKMFSICLACALALSLAACGGTPAETPTPDTPADPAPSGISAADFLTSEYPTLPADGPTVNLSLAHAMQESTDSHKMLVEMKNALEKYSDGKIVMTIYPNGQMGSDSEIIASCVAGDIDMVYQSGATHATFVPETTIFDTPLILAGYDSAKIEEVLTNSEFRDMFNEASEAGGLKMLMMRASGATYLTANKPVTNMDELKGLKIRTAQSESRMAIWRALGANPTPLSFNELYMALQNGTVDSQDNMLSNIISSALFEVQDYLIPTKLATPEFELTMNLDNFNALPAEYQQLLEMICEDLTAYDYAVSNAMEDSYYQALITEYGMKPCEVSDEFLSDMRTALAPAVETAKQAVNNDALYEALESALAG